ncbi:hypothetical protein [Ulvibacterium sp.]|uniref:hypothetical protein n=1 Tax=Ulvibacterium sp. TaxID=2665914 RepID=UPI003BAAF0A7
MEKSTLLIFSFIGLLFLSVQTNAQSFEKDWLGFIVKDWKIGFDRNINPHKEFLNTKSSNILIFTKNDIRIEYLIINKTEHPDFKDSYENHGQCLSDELSGEHGQIQCFFEFKDNYYAILGTPRGRCLNSQDEVVNCRDLDKEIMLFIRKNKH